MEVQRTEQGPRKLPFNEAKPAKVANPRSIRDHAEQLANGALKLAESGGDKHATGGYPSAVVSEEPRWYGRRVHQLIDGRQANCGFCWRPTRGGWPAVLHRTLLKRH